MASSSAPRSILPILATLWMIAWAIAGYFMAQAGGDRIAQSEYVARPATDLARGADVRVEGVLVDGPTQSSPIAHTPCLAAVADIDLVTSYSDAQGKTQLLYDRLVTRRVGPTDLEIAIGDRRLELPLERWTPAHDSTTGVDRLPPDLGISDDEIARARAKVRHGYSDERAGGFALSETTIAGGIAVFVAGTIEDRDGPLRLAPDRVLGKVVLHPGTQADYAARLRGSGGGLRIAAAILALGVGPLPLAILGLVAWRRRR